VSQRPIEQKDVPSDRVRMNSATIGRGVFYRYRSPDLKPQPIIQNTVLFSVQSLVPCCKTKWGTPLAKPKEQKTPNLGRSLQNKSADTVDDKSDKNSMNKRLHFTAQWMHQLIDSKIIQT